MTNREKLNSMTDADLAGFFCEAMEKIAEEVSFVGSATENSTQAKSEPSAYTPSAYGNTTAPQFEEIPNDEGLPF
jgi:hypothetical protein